MTLYNRYLYHATFTLPITRCDTALISCGIMTVGTFSFLSPLVQLA